MMIRWSDPLNLSKISSFHCLSSFSLQPLHPFCFSRMLIVFPLQVLEYRPLKASCTHTSAVSQLLLSFQKGPHWFPLLEYLWFLYPTVHISSISETCHFNLKILSIPCLLGYVYCCHVSLQPISSVTIIPGLIIKDWQEVSCSFLRNPKQENFELRYPILDGPS